MITTPEHAADRWYSGCGIYRPATLTVCDKLHVAEWGVTIVSENIDAQGADVTVKADIHNEYKNAIDAEAEVVIIDPKGDICAKSLVDIKIGGGDKCEALFNIKVDDT